MNSDKVVEKEAGATVSQLKKVHKITMEDDEYNVMGIDLGTTNSCIAVWKNGQIAIVPNEMGLRTTPSVVSFFPNETLVGYGAANKMTQNYHNTIFDCKRLIGHKISDPEIREDISSFPYSVVGDENGYPVITVNQSSSGKTQFTPQEISGMILDYLRVQAESFSGRKIRDAVITVPAYFNEEQRQATIEAAKLAKLNVLRLLDEPSAAAFAYNFEQDTDTKHILIYDLGGGTLDVSLLEVGKQRVHVISSVGNNHLGGEDFNHVLMSFLFEQYKRQKGVDISTNEAWRARMRKAVESCKVFLSSTSSSLIEFENDDFTYSVSRFLFEKLNRELFQRTLEIVKETLQRAGLTRDDVDEVILVGGSTRIPRIQQILSDYFSAEKMCNSVNPDEAVAVGAAIMAAVEKYQRIKSMPHKSILSLGVETHGGLMDIMIPLGSSLPATSSYEYTIPTDYQSTIEFRIAMGERLLIRDNIILGSIVVNDMPLCKTDALHVMITMTLSCSHSLHVTVDVTPGQRRESIEISLDRDNPLSPLLMSQEEIQVLINRAQSLRQVDEELVRRHKAMNVLECVMEEGYGFLYGLTENMPQEWIRQKYELLENTHNWMKNNVDADCASCKSHEQLLRKNLHAYRKWMCLLQTASNILRFFIFKLNTLQLDVLLLKNVKNTICTCRNTSTRSINSNYTLLIQIVIILRRNDTSSEHEDIVTSLLLQTLNELRNQSLMSSSK